MKRVLVTGAAGFIGNKLIEYFKTNNYDVVGWDCLKRQSLNIEKIDLLNETEVFDNLKKVAPDILIHCAGSADVGKSIDNPTMDFNANVVLTHNLLFSLYKLGLKDTRFIYLSTAGVYGNPISLPITEDMEVNPLSPYAVHKVMSEDLCKYFSKTYNMQIKIARIFSAYGAGLRKQIFWDMNKKIQNTAKLEMFGTGNESRDFIHIDDVVSALYLIATKDSDYTVFNVANGEEVTIRQATELYAECAGIDKDRITFNNVVKEGDPLNWRADISRIKGLSYKKSVDMTQGLLDYNRWVEKCSVKF